MAGSSRVPAGDLTQDDKQVVVESFSYPSGTIPRRNQAAGRPLKRREPPLDVREGKRTKSLVIGGGFGPIDVGDVHQSQCSSEESELPSSSGQPTETAFGNVMGLCFEGSRENEQHFRLLEVDGVKDKISIGHSGAQKDFVEDLLEQLCVKLKGLDVREGKQSKSLVIGGGSDPTDACDVHQSQGSSEESELPSSSRQPTEAALGIVKFDRGSPENEQHFRVDGVKHKIFLSHSGAQKNFVEQLCVDLERGGYIAPFFDQKPHSLPEGEDFVPLIMEAARHCEVAVIALSEEFLSSKWPMVELAAFHGAQQAGNQRLNMLPLFYKLGVEDLSEKSVEKRWMPKWLELAKSDKRIDVVKWSEAVKALRKVNGHVFGEKGSSEVLYRKHIVRSIVKLLPPDLCYGSSRNMVGFTRMCKEVSNGFVRDMSGGPSFLGIYGPMGTGKTTLAMALCDHFCREYTGRVCLVDMGETDEMSSACHVGLMEPRRLKAVQLERVKRILGKLCGLGKKALKNIIDVRQGWELMRKHMNRQPVFLALDNVTSESSSWNETNEYLRAGFHPESKIMTTSRSIYNIGGFVPDIQWCVPMPSLSVTEAGELFLRSAHPPKSLLQLSSKHQNIVDFCIKQCLIYKEDWVFEFEFDDEEEVDDEEGSILEDLIIDGMTSFHPIALTALGDFFRRHCSNSNMVHLRGHLEKTEDWRWVLGKVQSGIGGIFELQFHSLSFKEQLLFLDIGVFSQGIACAEFYLRNACVDWRFDWLRNVYGETRQGIERQLQDLEVSGMITFGVYENDFPYARVAHDLYKRFAKWRVTNHGVKLLENAWCVCKPRGSTRNRSSALWSDLVRLRMFDITLESAKLLRKRMIHRLRNLEVLQLYRSYNLTELNLEGLVSLRRLELTELEELEVVKLTGSSDTTERGGIFMSLRCVILIDLRSLVQGPDVRLCTSLHVYSLKYCPLMTNLSEMGCPHLKELNLMHLVEDQILRLPDLSVFHLEDFYLTSECYSDISPLVKSYNRRSERCSGELSFRLVEDLLADISSNWDVHALVHAQSTGDYHVRNYVRINWSKEAFHVDSPGVIW